jgi:hypothetical protein
VLNSDRCYRKEMAKALKRHEEGKARVIPVILCPSDWEKSPFRHLMAALADGKPITRSSNRNPGFWDATKQIRPDAEEHSATLPSSR